jgi:hypothetical protein
VRDFLLVAIEGRASEATQLKIANLFEVSNLSECFISFQRFRVRTENRLGFCEFRRLFV